MAYNENGLYDLDFYLTNNNKLYINDIEAKEEDLVDSSSIEELKEAYDYVDLPKLNHYKISNLTYKPDIKILDENNNSIDYEVKDNAIYATNFYKTNREEEAMQKLNNSFDTLAFAKNWSLFLSRDLNGATHGFGTLNNNLIKNTSMYKKAYDWATGVDITFISRHTLDANTFTNTKVSNFTV